MARWALGIEICEKQPMIVIAACALIAGNPAGAASAPVMPQPSGSEAQLAEVLVVGKQPGPGLWRISKGDHDL